MRSSRPTPTCGSRRDAGWSGASSGLVVLGAVPVLLAGLDLKGCAMRTVRAGETLSQGSGAASAPDPVTIGASHRPAVCRRLPEPR